MATYRYLSILCLFLSNCGSPKTCMDLTCGQNAACVDEEATDPVCVCDTGFEGADPEMMGCIDIDECTVGTDNCDLNATCANTPGTFTCTCNAGWQGTGDVCTDIDECADQTDNCDPNATCTNIDASFTCDCNDGWEGDGVTCTDIDECALGTLTCADPNASCNNLPGSAECVCNMGWVGDKAGTCVDVNECAAGTDTCTPTAQECINQEGSFACCDVVMTDASGYRVCKLTTGADTMCDDITVAGGATASCASLDCTTPVTLPFTFTFYGTAFTSAMIVSHGKVGFPTSPLTYANSCTMEVNNIAAYWDDLNGGGVGALGDRYQTLGTAPDRRWQMQWVKPPTGGTGNVDIRLVLYETSNAIKVCYFDTDTTSGPSGASATTGIRGSDVGESLVHSCNTAMVPTGTVLFYLPPGISPP